MLQVGQKLWFVGSHRHSGDPCEVIVEKIGRKWATIDKMADRIDIETLVADGNGYSSPGRCYLSRAEYESKIALDNAWGEFTKLMRNAYQMPNGMTVEKIAQARAILGL